MDRVELLLPAGDVESLRAAVANGADAVYLGLDAFNARRMAPNFDRRRLADVVRFCHQKGVRVHVAANTLVKNDELLDYFGMVGVAGDAGADAVIVQDPCLVPHIRKVAPGLEVHLSTQATTSNPYAIPSGVDRVILPRELRLEEVAEMARAAPCEMFVHGALCLSYSGQCLFSSMAGGRSGNRGLCAQPCRQRYNGSYPLSTRDLCLVERLPEVLATGVRALKVEGRMRGPIYAGVVARVYRKYVDMAHAGGEFRVDGRDLEELKLAFNRDFTTGFAFNDSVVDSRWPHNRGLFLGTLQGGRLRLRADLRVGDGVAAFRGERKSGNTVRRLVGREGAVSRALKGDVVEVDVRGGRDGDPVFKTFSVDLKVELGEEFRPERREIAPRPFRMPELPERAAAVGPSLHVKVHDVEGAGEAARAGAAVVYYDIDKEDFGKAREAAREGGEERTSKRADERAREGAEERATAAAAKAAAAGAPEYAGRTRFFAATPRVLSGAGVERAVARTRRLRPDGALVGERGVLDLLRKAGAPLELHLDHSFNVFNDIDLACWPGVPVISPELSLAELAALRSKDFIVMVHGPLVLVTTREPLKDTVLRDGSGRAFRVRRQGGLAQVLNCSELGLYNRVRDLMAAGVRRFFIEGERNIGTTVRNYMRIVSGKRFNDRNARHGRTTGHLGRGVA